MNVLNEFNFDLKNINFIFSNYLNYIRTNTDLFYNYCLEDNTINNLIDYYNKNNIEFENIDKYYKSFLDELKIYINNNKCNKNLNKEINNNLDQIFDSKKNNKTLKLGDYYGNLYKNILIPNDKIFFVFLLFENYLVNYNKNNLDLVILGNKNDGLKFSLLDNKYNKIMNYIEIHYNESIKEYKGNIIFLLNKNIIEKNSKLIDANFNLKEIDNFIKKIDSKGNNLINLEDIKKIIYKFSLDYTDSFVEEQFKKVNKRKYSYSEKEYLNKSLYSLDKKDILKEVNDYKNNNLSSSFNFWNSIMNIIGIYKPKIIKYKENKKINTNLFNKKLLNNKPDLSLTKNYNTNLPIIKDIKPLIWKKKKIIEADLTINNTDNIYEKIVQNLEEKESSSQLEHLINDKFDIQSKVENQFKTIKFSTKKYFNEALNLSYKPELLKDKENFFIYLSNLKKKENKENINESKKKKIINFNQKNELKKPIFKSHFKPQSVFALKLEQVKITQKIKNDNLLIDPWIPPYLYEFRDFTPNYDGRSPFKTRLNLKDNHQNNFKESNYYYELEINKNNKNKVIFKEEEEIKHKKIWQNYIKNASKNQMLGSKKLFPILEKGYYDNANHEFFYKEDLFEFDKIPFKTFFKCLKSEDKHLMLGDNN